MRRLGKIAILAAALCMGTARAEAIPVLQLDMLNGVYDNATETIVAPNGEFTLYALLTPKTDASASQIAALLSETYYVSVAITPQVHSAQSLGSFTFGAAGGTQHTVAATSGMTYGVPPLDSFMQGHDGNDLGQHGIYPTYFAEFEFQFRPVDQSGRYNTQDNPGGLAAGTGAYYAAFTGNSSLLAAGYNLHFDLYDTVIRKCAKSFGAGCSDIDVDRFAPFSHDAGTDTPPPPVIPEPGTLFLLATGLAISARQLRKRSR